MIMQWLPTFCGRPDKPCKPSVEMSDFPIHGLWRYRSHSFYVYWTDEKLWKHEWAKHGYCTSKIVPDVEYFNGAITSARRLRNMLKTLKEGKMGPTNHKAYTVMDMKTFISKRVLEDKNIDVYISCERASSSYVFLKQIHFCLDKSLNTFISCPKSTATRGCGRGNVPNLIFPTRAIYH